MLLNKIGFLLYTFWNRASGAFFVSAIILLLGSCTHKVDTVGYYKVGNPYEIEGKTYIPKEQKDYDEVGIASWYGKDFHKKQTAAGGTFDRNAITAAHRTLPMPCMVRVTNLRNNKTIVAMVNDRGPFSKNRILDVSERAAELLDFKTSGTTKVRVQYLPEQTKLLLAQMPESKKKGLLANKTTKDSGTPATTPNPPAANSAIATNSTIKNPEPTPPEAKKTEEKIEEISQAVHYVQAGIYSMPENAQHVEKKLAPLGTTAISPVKLNGNVLYKVTIGPIMDKKVAELTLKKTIMRGHPDAILVKN